MAHDAVRIVDLLSDDDARLDDAQRDYAVPREIVARARELLSKRGWSGMATSLAGLVAIDSELGVGPTLLGRLGQQH